MEDYIQFSAKTKNEAITKACLELGTSSDQLDIQVISEGSSGFFGIGSKPAVIKVRRIEPVSDMQEIDELVESVKLDAIKEEKKLEKPFTPDVKKESAPKAAPAEEKKPVKKEAVQVEKASEEAPAKAAAPKERPARDFQGKAKPAREKQPRAQKERQPKETRERAPKQGRPIEILSDPEKIREVEERAVYFFVTYSAPWILEKWRSHRNTTLQTVLWMWILKVRIWVSSSEKEARHWILFSI